MIELNVKFYEVKKDGFPKESGDYLCFVNNIYYASLPFSTRHQCFNCIDKFGDAKTRIDDVTFWAFYPNIPIEVEKET